MGVFIHPHIFVHVIIFYERITIMISQDLLHLFSIAAIANALLVIAVYMLWGRK